MEGENMIAMTMPSMRVVVLIGDLLQSLPTVLSEGTNEGAVFLKLAVSTHESRLPP
jgi:hypothetical protein